MIIILLMYVLMAFNVLWIVLETCTKRKVTIEMTAFISAWMIVLGGIGFVLLHDWLLTVTI